MNGKLEIQNYINQFVENSKHGENIDKLAILKDDLKNNLLLGIIIWIAGSTIIGIPIVYGTIAYRGFCFGYSIAAIIAVLGTKQGVLISIFGIMIQNLAFIPSIILIAASGMKLYKTIIKEKNRENIKVNIAKHTIISAFGICGILLSSLIEIFISTNFLSFFAKYM